MNQPIHEPNFEGEEMKLPNTQPTVDDSPEVIATPVVSPALLIVFGIILITILGGLAYWYYLVISTPVVQPASLRPTTEMNNEPESTTAEARTETMDVISTSDDIDAIEADVLSTNLDDLDAELTAIDTELEAALQTDI